MTAPAYQDFTLSTVERTSSLWIKLEQFMAERLDKAHARNEQNLPPEETAKIRGEIAALKALMRLGREPMPPIDG